MAQNYFKVMPHMCASHETGYLYFFDDEDRNGVQGAWDQAVAKSAPRAKISVYKAPPLRGPWDMAEVIGDAR